MTGAGVEGVERPGRHVRTRPKLTAQRAALTGLAGAAVELVPRFHAQFNGREVAILGLVLALAGCARLPLRPHVRLEHGIALVLSLAACVACLLLLHAIGAAVQLEDKEVHPFAMHDENGLKLMLGALSAYWMLTLVWKRNAERKHERAEAIDRNARLPRSVVPISTIGKNHPRAAEYATRDLESIMAVTRLRASARMLRECTCEQVMTRNVITVSIDTRRRVVERILSRNRIRALPAVDANGCLAGIVTREDLERQRVRPALVASDGLRLAEPVPASQTVCALMTRDVDSVEMSSSLETLLGLYVNKGHHHIPVLDAQRRIVGIVTTSDLVERLGWLPSAAAPSRR